MNPERRKALLITYFTCGGLLVLAIFVFVPTKWAPIVLGGTGFLLTVTSMVINWRRRRDK